MHNIFHPFVMKPRRSSDATAIDCSHLQSYPLSLPELCSVFSMQATSQDSLSNDLPNQSHLSFQKYITIAQFSIQLTSFYLEGWTFMWTFLPVPLQENFSPPWTAFTPTSTSIYPHTPKTTLSTWSSQTLRPYTICVWSQGHLHGGSTSISTPSPNATSASVIQRASTQTPLHSTSRISSQQTRCWSVKRWGFLQWRPGHHCDVHAPINVRTVPFSCSAPWFTSAQRMKVVRHPLERHLLHTGLTVHWQTYQDHPNALEAQSQQILPEAAMPPEQCCQDPDESAETWAHGCIVIINIISIIIHSSNSINDPKIDIFSHPGKLHPTHLIAPRTASAQTW